MSQKCCTCTVERKLEFSPLGWGAVDPTTETPLSAVFVHRAVSSSTVPSAFKIVKDSSSFARARVCHTPLVLFTPSILEHYYHRPSPKTSSALKNRHMGLVTYCTYCTVEEGHSSYGKTFFLRPTRLKEPPLLKNQAYASLSVDVRTVSVNLLRPGIVRV
jgi:hypothetical protein